MRDVILYPKYLCPLVTDCSGYHNPKDHKTQYTKKCLLENFNLSCPGDVCSHHLLLKESVWEVCLLWFTASKANSLWLQVTSLGLAFGIWYEMFFSIRHCGSAVSWKLGCVKEELQSYLLTCFMADVAPRWWFLCVCRQLLKLMRCKWKSCVSQKVLTDWFFFSQIPL